MKIKGKIKVLQSSDDLADLEIPGRFPYEGGAKAMTVSPVTKEDKCTLCGVCADVCPYRGHFHRPRRGHENRAVHPLLRLHKKLSGRRKILGRRDDELPS